MKELQIFYFAKFIIMDLHSVVFSIFILNEIFRK